MATLFRRPLACLPFVVMTLVCLSLMLLPATAQAQVISQNGSSQTTQQDSGETSSSLNASISGYVMNAETGERLPAANISLSYGPIGTSSDADGHFELGDITPGTYTVISSFIGYRRFEQEVHLEPGEALKLQIPLRLEPLQMDELVVQSEIYREWESHIGAVGIDASEISGMPSVLQADVFRTLQMLPGVASISDFSSGLYVRGGSPDQTLIELDGAPIYNPSHFFGFYSTFNPEAISDVHLYKGTYPAQYGGRLGSVLSVSNKQGSRDQFGGSASLGVLAASATVGGPLPEDQGSWMLGIRRSTLGPVLGMLKQSFEDIPEEFFLQDLNGRMNLDIDPRNRISLSFYSGEDHLEFPFARDAGINLDYGNQVVSSSWQHLFSDDVYTEFYLTGSRYFNYPEFDAASTGYQRSNNIYELSLGSDTEYRINEEHRLEVGGELGFRNLSLEDKYDGNATFDSQVRGVNTALYVKDRWEVNDQVGLTPGLRLNHYGAAGDMQLEPRVTMDYEPVEAVRLTGAFGHYSQDLTLISNESFSGMDVWLAANDGVPVSTGEQYAVGLEITGLSFLGDLFQRIAPSGHSPGCPPEGHSSGRHSERHSSACPPEGHSSGRHPEANAEGSPRFGHTLSLNIEFYYRTMENLFEPDPLLFDQSGIPYGELFRYGQGYAQGMEVSLEQTIGPVSGFAGYTLSDTRRRFPEVSETYYRTRFDRTHNLNLMVDYEINDTWSVTGLFNYTSGQPYTEMVGRMPYYNSPLSMMGKLQAVPGEKNAAELPAYHRLDLGLIRKGSFFDVADSELNLQLLNVYSRRNVWFYSYDLAKGADYRSDVQLLPLLPGISYSIYF